MPEKKPPAEKCTHCGKTRKACRRALKVTVGGTGRFAKELKYYRGTG